jgi:hypothetical protein
VLARTSIIDDKEEGTMHRREILVVAVIIAIGATAGWVSGDSFAQEKSVKEQLVGGWTLVSVVNTRPDGTTFDPTDGKGTGLMTFDGMSNFSFQNIRSDIPKLASNNRQQGTPDEFKSMAQGVLSYFGTYSLDDTGKILTQHVQSSSFPNFNGADRKWSIAISDDDLILGSQVAASGGSNELKWKRVK